LLLNDTHSPDPETAAVAAFISVCDDAYAAEVMRTGGNPKCLRLPLPQTSRQYLAFNEWQRRTNYLGRIEFILPPHPVQ
jgi:hypothetical protein